MTSACSSSALASIDPFATSSLWPTFLTPFWELVFSKDSNFQSTTAGAALLMLVHILMLAWGLRFRKFNEMGRMGQGVHGVAVDWLRRIWRGICSKEVRCGWLIYDKLENICPPRHHCGKLSANVPHKYTFMDYSKAFGGVATSLIF